MFPLELRLAEQKVIGQGTNFTSGSLEVMPIDTASIYAPWFLNPRILPMGETTPATELRFRTDKAFWSTLPQPLRYLAGTLSESSKAVLPFYQASCFRMVGNMEKSLNFIAALHLPWSELFDPKQWSVEYHNDGLVILETAESSFGRIIACREAKFISRVSVYSSENKVFPLSR